MSGVAAPAGRWRPLQAELPSIVAALACTVAVLAGWRGADWPAQLFRVGLFERDGFTLWNNRWYGGHHVLGNSVLFPALGALVGPATLGVLSAVVATACFDRLVRHHVVNRTRARFGAAWFGLATVTNLAVGRLTFLLGLALGMAALLAAQRGRRLPTLVLSLACPLASPVAGAFLALAWAAWGLARRRPWPILLAACTLAPLGLLALAFPTGGTFPFGWPAALAAAGLSAAGARVLPRHQDVLRTAMALYAVAVAVTWAVPNPLGANISRLWVYALGPVLACTWERRVTVAALAMVPVLSASQWLPAVDAVLRAPRDPSADAAYHQPLIDELLRRGGDTARVEIPFTRRHWEAHHVAAAVPLARGWERQLDIATNPLFYEPGLDAATYDRWLRDNAVRFVALPDVELDESAQEEARLLEEGIASLRLVWADEHWRLWERWDRPDLVDGPATVVSLDDDRVELDVHGPGDVVVRVRASTHWRVVGPGCAQRTEDGWTRLTGIRPGRVVLEQVLVRTTPLGGSDACGWS